MPTDPERLPAALVPLAEAIEIVIARTRYESGYQAYGYLSKETRPLLGAKIVPCEHGGAISEDSVPHGARTTQVDFQTAQRSNRSRMTAPPTDTSPPDDSEHADAPDSAVAEAAPDPAETAAAAGSPEASAAPPEAAKIDFERAEFEEPKRDEIECGVCHRTIRTEYWQVGGNKILCEPCRKLVDETAARANGGAAFGKAFLYGGGAALLCGTGYAIFVAVSDFQFALVTIGIGWAVGTAIQKVTRGFGGRKYQILAVALTYFATTMSYAPAMVTELLSRAQGHTPSGSTAPGATGAPASAPANAPAPAAPEQPPAQAPDATDSPAPASRMNPGVALLIFVAIIVAFMLAAPFLGLGSGGISGLLGLLIIFFGLRMAWRISKGITPTITGPHQVDASDAA